MLKMQNVSLKRDNSYLLSDINWEVRPGEHWAVIGLNGSGKTSLLKLITGYIRPSTGSMTVLGKTFGRYDLRELRKSIGWVSSSLQEQLHVNDSVLDIVISGKFATIGIYDKVEESDVARAHLLLDQLDCSYIKDRVYSTLSQGEKQKTLIARALMNSPRILILDEPSNGLDIFAREKLLASIPKLCEQKDGPCILYVSHHIDEILPCFNHTLLLQNGKIHSLGNTEEIITSANLSEFFATPVTVNWKEKRPSLNIESLFKY